MRSVLNGIVFFIITSQVTAQNDSTNYRFGFSISAFSTMNYGLKSFYNLETNSTWDEEYGKVYKNEKYTVDYQNFNFSKDFDLQLSVNWINNENYILRQSFSVFRGRATERATLTLTGYGEKTGIENYSSIYQSDHQYWSDNLSVGYQTKYKLESTYFGVMNSLVLFKKFSDNLNFGGGFSIIGRYRSEFYPVYDDGYLYGKSYVPYDQYYTRQFCLSTQIEKNVGRFTGFIFLSQSLFILKKNKGHHQVAEGELLAVSNNLDYRFPLYFKAGLTVNFKKLKKK